MTQRISAVDIAIAFLRKALAEKQWHGHRVPSINNLAKAAGVSRVPMWQAVQKLKDEGVFTVISRGAIRTPDSINQPENEINLGHGSWRQKKAVLLKDLWEGRIASRGTLPSLGEMRATYGVSHPTLKKILQSISVDGLIIPHKKTYRLAKDQTHSYQPTVVFISDGSSINEMDMTNPGTQKLVDALENDAALFNLRLEPLGMNTWSEEVLTKLRVRLQDHSKVAGYIINLFWWDVPETRRRIIDLVSIIATYGKPVAILDQMGRLGFPQELLQLKHIQVFRISATTAGKCAARFLYNLGHRNIAYISAHHSEQWSIDRLAGIRNFYANTGLKHKIVPATSTAIFSFFDLALSLCPFDAKVLKKIYARRLPKSLYEDWEKQFLAARKKNFLPNAKKETIRALQAPLAMLEGLAEKEIDRSLYNQMLDQVFFHTEDAAMLLFLEPYFARLVSDPSITAWIAANDKVALWALQYLTQKKIRVPQHISIVGFDNSPLALTNHQTTVDFRMAAIAHQTLMFVLAGTKKTNILPKNVIEVEGTVVERKTTGKARG